MSEFVNELLEVCRRYQKQYGLSAIEACGALFLVASKMAQSTFDGFAEKDEASGG